MRISELSAQTGVTVPTIKYYLREGLLPEGERSAPMKYVDGDDPSQFDHLNVGHPTLDILIFTGIHGALWQ